MQVNELKKSRTILSIGFKLKNDVTNAVVNRIEIQFKQVFEINSFNLKSLDLDFWKLLLIVFLIFV